jgi:TetR/AcrR family fatty acid metabolism transcriptional regulator
MSGRQRSSRGGDKRERILAAAVRVFATHGFYTAKISQVAREASVADGTIYLYFKNKDDLLISTFEDRMRFLIARLSNELEPETIPVVALRKIIDLHLRLAIDDRHLAKFITVELRQSSKFIREYSNELFSEYLSMVCDVIMQGQETGAFRPDIEPRIVTRAFFGALDEATLALALSRHEVTEAQVARQARELEKLLIGGLTASAQAATQELDDAG